VSFDEARANYRSFGASQREFLARCGIHTTTSRDEPTLPRMALVSLRALETAYLHGAAGRISDSLDEKPRR
jgi:hypothetical protein